MKQFLLATALIAVPIAAFTAFQVTIASAPVAAAQAVSLGDMSPYKSIVTDVQSIAATGDLTAAEARITDFETAWDEAAGKMRPLNTSAWGTVDDAADAALHALRVSAPAAADVTATLSALMTTLDNPDAGSDAAPVAATLVSGIAVTDANGRAIPCEDMLTMLGDGLAAATLSDADRATAVDFQTKATERCNADDDTRADAFSAQALAVLP